jgi:heme oxygenase
VSVQSVAAANPSIVALLRSRTQDAHSALEAQLGLLDQPASIDYYAHLLLRLLGFHLVWENDLQEFPTLASLTAGDRPPVASWHILNRMPCGHVHLNFSAPVSVWSECSWKCGTYLVG